MVGKLWNSGASVLKTGGALIGTMGVAMQQKLEETGIQQKVSTFVSAATEKTVEVTHMTLEAGSKLTEKTVEVGSQLKGKTVEVSTKLYHSSADTLSTIAANPTIQDLTNKSKAALNVVTDKVSDASQVVVQKFKEVVLEEDDKKQPQNQDPGNIVPNTLDEDQVDSSEVKIQPPE